MKYVKFALTKPQIKKLQNGEHIQVGPKHLAKSSGSGVPLLVDPDKYNAIKKAFDSNKGIRFKLNQSEMEANANPDSIDDDQARELIAGSGVFAGAGKRAKKGYAPRTEEEKRARNKRKKKKKKGDDPFAEIGKIGYDIEQSAKDTGHAIEKGAKDTGYAIQESAEEVGKTMKGISKAVLGKRATRALIDAGYELKDVAVELGEDLVKEVESLGDEVLGEFLEEFKHLSNEVKETIRKLDKASKLISRNITPDKWGNLVKEIPRYYRAELRDGPVGMLLREAIRQGAKAVMTSAIKAMYSNPYTAPLAPAAEVAYKMYGKQAIEELVKVSGAGMYAGGGRKNKNLFSQKNMEKGRVHRDSKGNITHTGKGHSYDSDSDDSMVGGGFSIPKAPREIRKAIDKLKKDLKKLKDKPFVGDVVKTTKKQIQTLKKALDRIEGMGMYAGGGMYASGEGVALQHEATIPNFLLRKQQGLPIVAKSTSVRGVQKGHSVRAKGGGLMHGIQDYPATHAVPKPRPIKRVTLLTGHA